MATIKSRMLVSQVVNSQRVKKIKPPRKIQLEMFERLLLNVIEERQEDEAVMERIENDGWFHVNYSLI